MRTSSGEHGGNPEIGCVLPGILDEAGLDVELRVAINAIRSPSQEWRWPDSLFRQLLAMLIEKDYLDRDILDEFMTEWDARAKDPSAIIFSFPVLEVIGRRPANT